MQQFTIIATLGSVAYYTISDDTAAEVHHAAALCNDTTATLSIVLDGFSAGFVLNQSFQMLFRIAARKVEQIDAVKVRYVYFRVEESDILKTVYRLLINEGEALRIACNEYP